MNNAKTNNGHRFGSFSWRITFAFLVAPIVLNLFSTVIILTRFKTLSGVLLAEMSSTFLFYLGNWPSLLLEVFPYDFTADGEIIYPYVGWLESASFLINVLGWGLVGFISTFVIRKILNAAHQKQEPIAAVHRIVY